MSLEPCPSSPNCVSSQADPGDAQHYMAPLSFEAEPPTVMAAVEAVLASARGASVKNRSENRVDAVFTSRIFRFKDDVTFEIDPGTKTLHFRSASRVGQSDLGANRKRLKALVPQIQDRL